MNTTDLAWAAGLFEGEGCFSGHYNTVKSPNAKRRWYPSVCLGMTDQDAVERFAKIMGVGSVHIRQPRGLGKKPLWYWHVVGEQALEVGERLRPWLCKRRTARLDEINQLYAANLPAKNSHEFRYKKSAAWLMFHKRWAELTSKEKNLVGNRNQRQRYRAKHAKP